MIKNYFKTAWRTMTKNRVYSLINIIGLTIGLCSCMIVATVVIDDLSYDRQWSKGDDLYRIITVNKIGDGLYDRFASSFTGLGTKLKNDYPEVEAVAEMTTLKQRFKLSNNNPNGVEVTALRADTAFWKMLDVNVISGNPHNYVEGSGNIVISESFRKKFFPKENLVGKIIYDVPTYSEKASPFLITGVIKDIPSNTVLRSDIIMIQKGRTEDLNKKQYGTFSQNYILMRPGTNMTRFTNKINKWYAGFVDVKNPYQFEFQPMKDVYLHSDFAEYQQVKGSYTNIYILSGVALLLLIIACVNFINLSTARAIQRVRETGVRKILGAGRRQLIFQYLTESFLFFIIATSLATVIYQLSLHGIENYLGHQLALTFVSRFYLLVFAYSTILLISLLTGIYPACIISSFKPAATLKGKLYTSDFSGQNFVRKSLVVLQFSLSIIVLVALIVVQQQVFFMKTKDIGFNKNNLLSIGGISWDGKGESFKNELLNQQGVESASISNWTPSEGSGSMSKEIDDPNHPGNKINIWFINGDVDLAKTLGLHLKQGRLLSKSFSADMESQDSLMRMDSTQYQEAASRQSSVITAYTAKVLHVYSLNKSLPNAQTTPVGILEDFHNESLKDAMEPTIIVAEPSPQYGGMLVRIKPGSEKKVTASLNKLWRQFYPNKLLNVKWVDDMLANQYKVESKLQHLFTFFSGLSMFLAALGVFGLIVQATNQRVKEIGIRKVLGASINSIVRLFSIDFLKLIIVAAIIASPIAWLLMNKWLQSFAYRINISIWIFIGAGALAIAIALGTISFQAIKAALANPVDSLRSE
ncbi:MAG TPA: FtsX-like permease family protein [Hanamia sp.]